MRMVPIAACALLSSSCGGGPPPKPALPAPVAFTGTLVEQVTGEPLPSVTLKLGAYCYNCDTVKPRQAATGADGRFRFEGVALGSDGEARLTLNRADKPGADLTDSKAWDPLWILDPKEVYRGTSGEYRISQKPPQPDRRDYDKAVFVQIAGPVVDVGKVLVFDQEWAARAYGPVCESGRLRGTAPPAAFATVSRSNEKGSSWRYNDHLHRELAASWKAPFPAIFCIAVDYEVIGEYSGTTADGERRKATAVTWRLRLIDTRDGTIARQEFRAAPPLVTTQYKTHGDPTPDLIAWLNDKH